MAKVRVDFFRLNGTWYTTEEIEWTGTHKFLPKAFAETLYKHLRTPNGSIRLDDMFAVCLTSPHENQFPVLLNTGELPLYLTIDDSRVSETVEEENPPTGRYSSDDGIFFGY